MYAHLQLQDVFKIRKYVNNNVKEKEGEKADEENVQDRPEYVAV